MPVFFWPYWQHWRPHTWKTLTSLGVDILKKRFCSYNIQQNISHWIKHQWLLVQNKKWKPPAPFWAYLCATISPQKPALQLNNYELLKVNRTWSPYHEWDSHKIWVGIGKSWLITRRRLLASVRKIQILTPCPRAIWVSAYISVIPFTQKHMINLRLTGLSALLAINATAV